MRNRSLTARATFPAVTACIAFSLATSAFGQVDFRSQRSIRPAELPGSLLSADFDEDGHVDIALMCASDDQVFVYRGDGAGGLLAPTSFGFGEPLLATADLNEDGHVDILAVGLVNSEEVVSVLLGDGRGGFGAPRQFPSGGRGLVGLAMGDFDEDGHLDVAVAAFESWSVSILAGDGAGGLTLVSLFGSRQPARVIAADLNEDGHLDLCVLESVNRQLRVHLGDGFADFTLTQIVSVPSFGDCIAVDWNEDGHIDLYASGDTDAVLVGDGTGQLSPSPLAFGGTGAALISSDFDADGHPDVAGVIGLAGYFQVVNGDGMGGGSSRRYLVGNGAVRSIAAGDLDEDGRPDVATADTGNGPGPYYGGSIQLFSSIGSQGFLRAPTYPTGNGPAFVIAGDLNRDGHQDLVTANSLANRVSVLLGDGTGAVSAASNFAVGSGPLVVQAADLDGDGDLDLATANEQGNSVSILLGQGDGSFGAARQFAMSAQPKSVILADLNGDGIRDVATANATGRNVSIRDGLGNGDFGPIRNLSTGMSLAWVESADFDEDGNIDLAVAEVPGSVRLLLGDGSGGFTAGAPFAAGFYPNSLAVADLDGDGHLDIATANFYGETVSILAGDGSGSFAGPFDLRLDRFATHVIASDLDEDGDLDLAVADGTAAVLVNDGAFPFTRIRRFAAAGSTNALAAADLDEDGHPDLAQAQINFDLVGVLINRSLDPVGCRRGTVNAGSGPYANVLFVNGQAGAGAERRVAVSPSAPFEIRMAAPPSRPLGPSPFALFAWVGQPAPGTVNPLPRAIGAICMPILLTGGAPQPLRLANNLGFQNRLGTEQWPGPPTRPAPYTLLSIPSGLGRTGSFFLQGLIRDSASPSGVIAVTNGIAVESN